MTRNLHKNLKKNKELHNCNHLIINNDSFSDYINIYNSILNINILVCLRVHNEKFLLYEVVLTKFEKGGKMTFMQFNDSIPRIFSQTIDSNDINMNCIFGDFNINLIPDEIMESVVYRLVTI